MAPPVMKIWLVWSEMMNVPRITKEQFQAQLAKYPKSGILIACAKLSVGFNYGPDAVTAPSDQVANIHIPIVFPPKLVPRVAHCVSQGRVPFFNGQLRYLAAEIVRLKPAHPVAEDPSKGPQNDQFGELMLKSGELLYKKHVVVQDELDGYANVAAEFLPTYGDHIAGPIRCLASFGSNSAYRPEAFEV